MSEIDDGENQNSSNSTGQDDESDDSASDKKYKIITNNDGQNGSAPTNVNDTSAAVGTNSSTAGKPQPDIKSATKYTITLLVDNDTNSIYTISKIESKPVKANEINKIKGTNYFKVVHDGNVTNEKNIKDFLTEKGPVNSSIFPSIFNNSYSKNDGSSDSKNTEQIEKNALKRRLTNPFKYITGNKGGGNLYVYDKSPTRNVTFSKRNPQKKYNKKTMKRFQNILNNKE